MKIELIKNNPETYSCMSKLTISFYVKFYVMNVMIFLTSLNISGQHQHDHGGLHHWEIPSKNPDRIMLTFPVLFPVLTTVSVISPSPTTLNNNSYFLKTKLATTFLFPST